MSVAVGHYIALVCTYLFFCATVLVLCSHCLLLKDQDKAGLACLHRRRQGLLLVLCNLAAESISTADVSMHSRYVWHVNSTHHMQIGLLHMTSSLRCD